MGHGVHVTVEVAELETGVDRAVDLRPHFTLDRLRRRPLVQLKARRGRAAVTVDEARGKVAGRDRAPAVALPFRGQGEVDPGVDLRVLAAEAGRRGEPRTGDTMSETEVTAPRRQSSAKAGSVAWHIPRSSTWTLTRRSSESMDMSNRPKVRRANPAPQHQPVRRTVVGRDRSPGMEGAPIVIRSSPSARGRSTRRSEKARNSSMV